MGFVIEQEKAAVAVDEFNDTLQLRRGCARVGGWMTPLRAWQVFRDRPGVLLFRRGWCRNGGRQNGMADSLQVRCNPGPGQIGAARAGDRAGGAVALPTSCNNARSCQQAMPPGGRGDKPLPQKSGLRISSQVAKSGFWLPPRDQQKTCLDLGGNQAEIIGFMGFSRLPPVRDKFSAMLSSRDNCRR